MHWGFCGTQYGSHIWFGNIIDDGIVDGIIDPEQHWGGHICIVLQLLLMQSWGQIDWDCMLFFT